MKRTNTTMLDKVKILVVDDHPVVLAGVEKLLSDNYELSLATNGVEALALLKSQQIDVLITDDQMPQMSGIELVNHVKQSHATVKVIVFSQSGDLATIRAFIESGVDAILLKTALDTELELCIEMVCSNQLYYSREISKPLITNTIHPNKGMIKLTIRENEILKEIWYGVTQNKALADKLNISYETVRSNMKNLYSKFGVANRTELILKAKNLGFAR